VGGVFENKTIKQAIYRIALKEAILGEMIDDFNFIDVFEHFMIIVLFQAAAKHTMSY